MSELFRRGKIWYGFVWENGTRRMQSTRCTDKAAAETVFRQRQRSAADPDHARAQTGTLTAAIQLLITTREEQVTAGRRSEKTVDFYRKKSVMNKLSFETDIQVCISSCVSIFAKGIMS